MGSPALVQTRAGSRSGTRTMALPRQRCWERVGGGCGRAAQAEGEQHQPEQRAATCPSLMSGSPECHLLLMSSVAGWRKSEPSPGRPPVPYYCGVAEDGLDPVHGLPAGGSDADQIGGISQHVPLVFAQFSVVGAAVPPSRRNPPVMAMNWPDLRASSSSDQVGHHPRSGSTWSGCGRPGSGRTQGVLVADVGEGDASSLICLMSSSTRRCCPAPGRAARRSDARNRGIQAGRIPGPAQAVNSWR